MKNRVEGSIMKFIMNETNTMKKTLVFLYICKHKTQKQRVKTADGEENRSFWDQGGELNGPTGGGELNRIGWKNIHPCIIIIVIVFVVD